MHLKRIVPAILAAAAIAVPAAASAAPNPNAQCGTGAASGAFGAFGNNGSSGIHDMGQNKGNAPYGGTLGANGPATGANNSAICGQGPH